MEHMKKNVSFTLSETVANLLDDMSEKSTPHAFKSAIVETAIVDYAIKTKFIQGEDDESNKVKIKKNSNN